MLYRDFFLDTKTRIELMNGLTALSKVYRSQWGFAKGNQWFTIHSYKFPIPFPLPLAKPYCERSILPRQILLFERKLSVLCTVYKKKLEKLRKYNSNIAKNRRNFFCENFVWEMYVESIRDHYNYSQYDRHTCLIFYLFRSL